MEIVVFLAVVFVIAAVLIWRSRRGTSQGLESLTAGVPDDLRNKYGGFDVRGSQAGIGGHVGGGGMDGGGSDGSGGGL